MKLFKYDFSTYPAFKNTNLHCWAGVNADTGEVDMELQQYDDELEDLAHPWRWQKFELVPVSESFWDKFESKALELARKEFVDPEIAGGNESEGRVDIYVWSPNAQMDKMYSFDVNDFKEN